jgi:hypothetical protein
VEVQLHAFFTLELVGSEKSASRPGLFTPGGRIGTHWIGGWVDPRSSLDTVASRRNPSFTGNRILRNFSSSSSSSCTSLLVLFFFFFFFFFALRIGRLNVYTGLKIIFLLLSMYRCIFLTVFSSIKFLARFFLPSSEF